MFIFHILAEFTMCESVSIFFFVNKIQKNKLMVSGKKEWKNEQRILLPSDEKSMTTNYCKKTFLLCECLYKKLEEFQYKNITCNTLFHL